MAARLIFHSKFLYRDGAIREMILWELPEKVKPYRFAGVEQLVEDFLKDIEKWRRKKGKTDGPYPS